LSLNNLHNTLLFS